PPGYHILVKTTVEPGDGIVQWVTNSHLPPIDLRQAETNPMAFRYITPTSDLEPGDAYDQSMTKLPLLGVYQKVTWTLGQLLAIPPSQVPYQAEDTYAIDPNFDRPKMRVWEQGQEQELVLLASLPIPLLWQLVEELERQKVPSRFGRGFVS